MGALWSNRPADFRPDLPIAELGLDKRAVNTLGNHGISTVADFFAKFEEGGDPGILELQGVGRKILSDIKKYLRQRGYELPVVE